MEGEGNLYMAPASNTVDEARALLEQRRDELKAELSQIESAISGLGGRKRGPGRPRGSGGGTRRRGRRGGTWADQAVKLITENPGITVSELGRKMKLKAPNYLYRVLPDLEKEGRIRKKGSGYEPG
jgi:hypothetical protein